MSRVNLKYLISDNGNEGYPDDYHKANEQLERKGLEQLFSDDEITVILLNRRRVDGPSTREDNQGSSERNESQRRRYTPGYHD
jgi:hypothetical protein